ncbi:BCCT family transporter [Streptomyces bohaiensis]|uniref:BCCT family transporter n=1 Tax=Streptomyces bohaiensis TaxID=1431344 RepID=A0ABX1C4K1_9ACTN|nr:BCCT family transporter [Streptomyces bohaiensis]
MAPWVFWPSVAIIGVFVIWAMLGGEGAADNILSFRAEVVDNLSWYYVPLVSLFVVFALFMGFSKYGKIKLGKDGQKPDFGLGSWLAMLFAAGMGIGLVFWGVAEPLSFYMGPKPGVGEGEAERAEFAMSQTFLHWGFHPWAIYIVVGLAIAYAVHRKGRPVSIRWTLEPLFGDRVRGRLGDAIDVIAVVGTVFGVATSLGFGVQQIGAGLDHLGIIENPGSVTLSILVIVITLIATLSVVSGLDKGIKILSNTNGIIAAAILLFVLVAGSTTALLTDFFQNIGVYLQNFAGLSFDTGSWHGDEGTSWVGGWTVFYWGWWMSWAPFVGIFIARISRGRTVREFIVGALLVPTTLSFFWFSVIGGSGIREQQATGSMVGEDGSVDSTGALFALLDSLPGATLVIGVAILLIVFFFVTSSDSASYVVDMLASGGDPNPPTWSRVFWAVTQGLVAIALLTAGSGAGLTILQNVAVVIALPFSFVMIAMCLATLKSLRDEHVARQEAQAEEAEEALIESAVAAMTEAQENGELDPATSGTGSGSGAAGVGDKADKDTPGDDLLDTSAKA